MNPVKKILGDVGKDRFRRGGGGPICPKCGYHINSRHHQEECSSDVGKDRVYPKGYRRIPCRACGFGFAKTLPLSQPYRYQCLKCNRQFKWSVKEQRWIVGDVSKNKG